MLCPFCHHPCVVARRSLYAKGIFAQLACVACASAATARKWLCDCGQTWIGCHTHAQIGFACRRVALSKSGSTGQAPGGIPKQGDGPTRVHKRACTNSTPPPQAHHAGGVKRVRARQDPVNGNSAPSCSTALRPSHAPHPRPADSARSQGGCSRKRNASVQIIGRSRNRPPHAASSAVESINRLREAREHPI